MFKIIFEQAGRRVLAKNFFARTVGEAVEEAVDWAENLPDEGNEEVEFLRFDYDSVKVNFGR